jgi:hypothetical protein
VEATVHLKGTMECKAYQIEEVVCSLLLKWQDGSETLENSKELVPYHNVDE